MQLKNRKKQLAAIAGSLLGSVSSAQAESEKADWSYDVTAFNYSETEGRVNDKSLKFQAVRTTEREQILSLGLSFDSLTGASAGGHVDRSGSGQPRLTNIEDTRIAANLSLTQPVGDDKRITAGGSYSNEDDYLHTGVNISLAKDLNNKNTTFNLGYAHSADTIDGVVGNPVPGTTSQFGAISIGEQDKTVNDFLVGLTQVFSKNLIGQLNYSYSHSSGYLNDPYKVVSVIDNEGRPVRYIHELRPKDRTAHSIYGALNYKTGGGVLKPSYRFFTDDWGIDSHTLEFKYAYDLGQGRTLEPHIRLYNQSRADFYRGQLALGESPGRYLSSDYRLDGFSAVTFGMQYRMHDKSDREWRIGVDYYVQQPDANPDQLPGQNDLNPGISAVIARFGVEF